jgi:molybdopterin-containing oxidoreductase family iron-sulfur binding subunit
MKTKLLVNLNSFEEQRLKTAGIATNKIEIHICKEFGYMTSKTIQNPTRREFIKTIGVASTVTAAACSVDPISWDPLVPQEHAYPYVIQPEAVVPGVASHYATRCNQCSNSCGVVAKVREGRVINVEGNTNDPFNMGKLCSVGQSSILEHYSPDRIKSAKKSGTNVQNINESIASIAALMKSGAKSLWIGRYRSGASASLVHQFITATGGTSLFWEPEGTEVQQYAVDQVFGGKYNTVPTYNIQHAKTIISFGAEFLGNWGHNVKNHMGWADSRDPEIVGKDISQTITVGPRIGLSSTCADLHLFCTPGTEALVAYAIAKKVAEKTNYNGPATKILATVNLKEIFTKTNLNEKAFEKVVARLASGKLVALPGGVEASTNASSVAIGALLINEVGKSFEGKDATVEFGKEDVSSHGTGKEIYDALTSASSDTVLFLEDTDLVFQFGKAMDVNAALEKFGAVVHFLNESNDTLSDSTNSYVIPTGTSFETWGDAEVFTGNYVLQQPAMRPQEGFQVHSAEDILLGISRTNGLMAVKTVPVQTEEAIVSTADAEEAQPVAQEGEIDEATIAPVPVSTPLPDLDQKSFYSYLKTWWKSTIFEKIVDNTLSFDRFWISTLKNGGSFSSAQTASKLTFALTALPEVQASTGNTFLFPHPGVGFGRVANRSWLQEIPDPISSFSWGSWIEVNPKTAKKLGLTKPNGVSVQIDGTTMNVGWFGSPGIKEDQFALVMGNGHKNSGRYAKYGENPLYAMKIAFDPSGAITYPVVDSAVTGTKEKNAPSHQNELTKSDTLTRNGRGVNHTVSIDDLGKGQEKLEDRLAPLKEKYPEIYEQALKVEHASIVPEHHLPVDSMAVRARHTKNMYNPSETLTDMYPEPEHPTYRFAMVIDLNRCNGCNACDAACYAENNIPVVGPNEIRLGRSMGWSRLSRYWESPNGSASGDEDDSIVDVRYQPVMCQQCSHAPCEGVCPVLATYHNLDGLNAMVYNRCVGTRYCANNCPYSARRFNFHTYRWPESFNMMLNPDVLTREMGVMEKCTFCIQKIRTWKDSKRDRYEFSEALKIQPTDAKELEHLAVCAKACPSGAITFGNKNDTESKVGKAFTDERGYLMLGELNNKPGVVYLSKIVHTASEIHGHGGHGDDYGGHGDGHGGHGGHGDDHGHKDDHKKNQH